ncbi:probable cytochrome P450 313a4 [Bactrocera neohumeralis]|uniref:probable cytochrome P450 313a4 n=1 Tax=Bactrocera neohumeralis TaxID=98809 RepID=UPI0021652C6B|nr:probable cytochrome P450 313a4 [Bactrocera neohumeralis]
MSPSTENYDNCYCVQLRYTFGIVCLILTSYFYIYAKRKQFKNITTKIPTVFGLPFIGIAYKLVPIKRFLYIISSYFEEFNTSTYCAWLGTYPVIVTIDPDIIKTVTSSTEFLNKAEVLYNPINKAIPKGIISSEVSTWKHNRKLINGYFNHKLLMSLFPLFNRGANTSVKRLSKLSNGGEHKLFDLIKRVTLEISIEATMGVDMREGASKNYELIDLFTVLMERIAEDAACSTLGLGFLARTPDYYKSRRSLRNFMNKLIEERTNNNNMPKVEEWQYDEETMSSFLDIALNYCDNGKFEKEDVIIESISLIGASFETVATAIYSGLVMLSMHMDVQEKLFQEINSIWSENDIQVTYDHLKEVPYLDMVVAETLRLMPSIPIVGRQTIHQTKLTSDLILPPKMQVIVPIFTLHRAKTWWGPKAHLFNPDNFLPENIAKRNPYVYMPFSKGARNCIGWRYAEIAVRILLIVLVQNFKFSTEFKYEDLHFVDHVSLWYDVEPNIRVELRKL